MMVGFGFFDHPAGEDTHVPGAGRSPVTAGPQQPWTWEIAELFKVEKGLLHEIEAVLERSPYGMTSGWSSWEDGMSDRIQYSGPTIAQHLVSPELAFQPPGCDTEDLPSANISSPGSDAPGCGGCTSCVLAAEFFEPTARCLTLALTLAVPALADSGHSATARPDSHRQFRPRVRHRTTAARSRRAGLRRSQGARRQDGDRSAGIRRARMSPTGRKRPG